MYCISLVGTFMHEHGGQTVIKDAMQFASLVPWVTFCGFGSIVTHCRDLRVRHPLPPTTGPMPSKLPPTFLDTNTLA